MSVPDNVTSNPGSGGVTWRAFSDSAAEWAASVMCFVTGGSPGAWTLQEVTSTIGLPVSILGTPNVTLAAALPAGSNIIGAVTQSGSWSFSLSGSLPAGTNTIGGVELVDSGGVNKASISAGGAVKVDGSAVTQPVSISGAVAVSGNVTVVDSVPLQVVLTAAPTVIAGEFKLVDSGGTNQASISAAGALKVDGSAVTQPVSGTITVDQGGSWSVSLSAALPSGSNTIGSVDQAGTWTVSTNADGSVTGGAAGPKSLLIGAQYNSTAPTLTTGQQAALQTDVHGNLLVNIASGGGSGGTSSSFSNTFPLVGTAAGASDGTNMKPFLVDGSGFLKVNVSAGGGTSSNFGSPFPGTGTAVGASDGTDMRALEVDGSGNLKVNVVAGGGSGSNAAAGPTGSAVPTDADYQGLKVGANLQGQTGVSLSAGTVFAANTDLSSVGGTAITLGQAVMASSIPVVISSNQSAVPISGTVTANQGSPPWSQNLTEVGGAAISLGQALMASSVPVTIASNQSALSVAQSGSWTVTANGTITADQGGAWTVTANAGSGTFAVAGTVIADQGGAWNVGITGALPAGTNTLGSVTPTGATATGATPYHLVSAASNNATNVKAAAGTIYSIQAFNLNASPRFLRFYDKASAPVPGTDSALVVKTIMLPGNANGAGAIPHLPVGIKFINGISFTITGGIADTDNTAIGAGDCVINFDYV